jgi:hypothetical protein
MKNFIMHTVAVIVSVSLWAPNAVNAATVFNDEYGHDAYDDVTGISFWEWLDPDSTEVGPSQTVEYHVVSWDNDTVGVIEIYVNGEVEQVCEFAPDNSYAECIFPVISSEYDENESFFINAKILDRAGNETWTTGYSMHRAINDVPVESEFIIEPEPEEPIFKIPENNPLVNVWDWTDGDALTVATDGTLKYHAGAWAEAGLKKITMYVDGTEGYTCSYWPAATNNRECWTEINGQGRNVGGTVFVNALVRDKDGQEVWTEGRTITVTQGAEAPGETPNDPPTETPEEGNGAMNVWDWTDGNLTNVSTQSTLVYHAGAWAEDGLRKIIIYVDNEPEFACTYYPGTGNKECWTTLKGRDYAPGTNLYVNAKVRDKNGQEVWTNGMTITVTQ